MPPPRRRARAAAAVAALLAAAALAPAACTATPHDPPAASAAAPAAPVAPAAPDLLAALGACDIVDLTHPLDERVPYWPGARYFPFEAWDLARFEEVRAFSRAYRVPEHYGTHMDAPAHFLPGQATAEAVAPADLVGPAVVFDIAARAAADPDALLGEADVAAHEAAHGRIPDGAIVVLRTGWAERWGDAARYRNFDAEGRLHFPGYGLDAAKVLLHGRRCRGLVIDALSVDRGLDAEFPVHRLGSGLGRWFVENAAGLDRLPARGATVLVAPVPIRGGSGAQARVLAVVPRARR
jgi:kynurenine formamidase